MWCEEVINILLSLPALFCTNGQHEQLLKTAPSPHQWKPALILQLEFVGLRGLHCLSINFPFKAILRVRLSRR